MLEILILLYVHAGIEELSKWQQMVGAQFLTVGMGIYQ